MIDFLAANMEVEVNSLSNLAQVAVITTLFTREQPQRKLQQLFDKTPASQVNNSVKSIIQIGQEELQELVIPPPLLKEEMVQVIISISWEIMHWLVHYHKFGFDYNASIVKEFCWTTTGRIDGQKTARRLLQKKILKCPKADIKVAFKIAAVYCLQDEIKLMRSQNLQYLKDLYFCHQITGQFSNADEFESLWCRDTLEYEFPNEISDTVKPIDFTIAGKKLGNLSAMTYSYHHINFSSKKDEIEFLVKSLKEISLNRRFLENRFFPSSYRVGCFIFFLEKLNRDQLIKIFAEEPKVACYTVRKLLLYPFRHMFFKYASIAVDFVKGEHNVYNNSYCVLLKRIVKMVEQDFYFYNKAFIFIWERMGNLRLATMNLLRTKDFIVDLLVKGCFSIARLVLHSAPDDLQKKFLSQYFIFKNGETENGLDWLFPSNDPEVSIAKILEKQPQLEICNKFINSNFGFQYFVEIVKLKSKYINCFDEESTSSTTDNHDDSLSGTCIKVLNERLKDLIATKTKNHITDLQNLIFYEKFSAFLIDFLLKK